MLSTKSSAAPSSSAASFRTAPISNSSSTSSISTVNNASVNPMHALAQQRGEFHILKVTGDTVQVGSGPVPDNFIQKMSQRITTALDTDTPSTSHVQAPPSPPATDEEDSNDDRLVLPPKEEPAVEPSNTRVPQMSKPTQSEPITTPSVVFEEPEPIRRTRTSSASARQIPIRSSTLATDPRTDARTSIETTKTSLRTITPSESHPPSASKVPALLQPSQTDYLQPPPVSRPTRRNTTGSAFTSLPSRSSNAGVRASLLTSQHAQYGSTPGPGHTNIFPSDDPSDMTNDIQLHAERIRRERQEKRAKAEAALTREASVAPTHKDDDVPLVGNLIGEDHVNYVLMYNMLTGIRIGVSRCQAKIKRPLTDEDFTARHKYSFDIVGNELTPSAKYDFKFKDYAPWVFRSLREDYFHLDPADYLLSLTSKYILSELGSPGKSGSFFYFSRDYRFIIKTIHHKEHKFLLKVLRKYYDHVKSNPHTLISRFYGLHRVKLPRGRKIHFVIMNNLFPPHKDIHETYDLKGSTVGREWIDKDKGPESSEGSEKQDPSQPAPSSSKKKKTSPVLKDLNWIKKGNRLELGTGKARDKELLKSLHVMDYSLLVGIHNMQRGNRDNVRRRTLKVFEPDIALRRHASHSAHNLSMSRPKSTSYYGHSNSQDAIALRRAMREVDPKPFEEPAQNGSAVGSTPHGPVHIRVNSAGSARAMRSSISSGVKGKGKEKEEDGNVISEKEEPILDRRQQGDEKGESDNEREDSVLGLDAMDAQTMDRTHFVFYQDEGGLRATDENNENMDMIYYLGVIDILTPYNGLKKVEHFWKGLSADRHKISPVPPHEYAERFFKFMKAIMRGGDGGESFV
ncbi:Phosphatidylinositol-4-phosphate 5-kinase [Paramarasmius palmivorus]|uniref:1-phosphatidylinositol-4-phosphate 5-kinase n=1 Tax=Paramarasmius palmivorus TaxID=297713 RepID=A0AAW0BA92_9AGAR